MPLDEKTGIETDEQGHIAARNLTGWAFHSLPGDLLILQLRYLDASDLSAERFLQLTLHAETATQLAAHLVQHAEAARLGEPPTSIKN